ncbi:PAAR domain-containing protein [Paraburkholderia caballeronis]|uniref:PAAR domain-containing protein n=1 Tax=Paraburkholderia caballeronis TaxID=416943 RepID=UPI0010656E8D|nr:PAAR domain-containing protein [Paraburkholderia caballeronis]TDV20981.1 PAAR motif-containing protein [Paraburkholderia caballeronis]TDV21410.1 PAAR motif-containing protein [Paraburkholderia caballeronis]TDV33449.1 PAAR motif-containing protein [Paraburkholderia caballeronis]TDV37925.1 PAAR motif-containing protein [Paraburkholderia caballeronis]
MAERAYILQHDTTTAKGDVLDGLDDVFHNDRKVSYLGARVRCPACGTVGRIEADSPREHDDLTGTRPALEGDFCACGCNPKPLLIASQDDWTTDR